MSEKSAPKPEAKTEAKSEAKAEAKVEEKERTAEAELFKAAEKDIETDNTEMPDHSAIRAVEAHRQAKVGARKDVELDTGDDSEVHPQPDRDEAVGNPRVYLAEPDGERQGTEQPDRYAVNGADAEDTVEPNGKGRRGRRAKKDDSSSAEDASAWPAQYEGDGKDEQPSQYSY